MCDIGLSGVLAELSWRQISAGVSQGSPRPRDHEPRGGSRRRAARPVNVGLAAQDVQPAIEWRAEQGRHFGEEFGRLGVVLPRVVICLGIPDFQGSKAIGPIELLQDSIAQLAGRPAAVGTIAHQVVLTFAGIAVPKNRTWFP
jgi:hypothetical protein